MHLTGITVAALKKIHVQTFANESNKASTRIVAVMEGTTNGNSLLILTQGLTAVPGNLSDRHASPVGQAVPDGNHAYRSSAN